MRRISTHPQCQIAEAYRTDQNSTGRRRQPCIPNDLQQRQSQVPTRRIARENQVLRIDRTVLAARWRPDQVEIRGEAVLDSAGKGELRRFLQSRGALERDGVGSQHDGLCN
jgi:hypothetical protein